MKSSRARVGSTGLHRAAQGCLSAGVAIGSRAQAGGPEKDHGNAWLYLKSEPEITVAKSQGVNENSKKASQYAKMYWKDSHSHDSEDTSGYRLPVGKAV